MAHPLLSIRLKLERAKTHLDTVREMLRPFQHARVSVTREQDSTRANFYHCRLLLPAADPALSTIVGDCLHNLRSPLDHLVNQLIQLNGGIPSKSSQFPICDTPQGYRTQVQKGRVAGMSTGDAQTIERFQPYNLTPGSPHSEPLWILNELMNTDKHRAFNTIAVLATDLTALFGGPDRPGDIGSRGGFSLFGGRRKSGDIIFSGVREAVGGIPDLDAHAAMNVTFSEPAAPDKDVCDTLQAIIDFVEHRVIPAFEPRFP